MEALFVALIEVNMNKEFLYLNLLPIFSDFPKDKIESASLLWDVKQLIAGETLWWQGEPATELGFVVSGRFRSSLDGL